MCANIKPTDIAHHWNNVSFHPERQAEMAIRHLEQNIRTFLQHVKSLSQMDGCAEDFDPDAEAARFEERHTALHQAHWAAMGRCASPMITGPARFPADRNRKAMDSAERRYNEIEDHLKRVMKAVERRAFPHGMPGAPIRSNDPDALEKLRKRLKDAEEMHELGKKANRAWKKKGVEGLKSIGWPLAEIESCARLAATGFTVTPYFTGNGLARIKRLKQRIVELERAKTHDAAFRETTFEEVIMREDAEIMRVQIIFPGKPDAKTRAVLKRNGFRWAPSHGAWQRHLNTNGVAAARMVIEEIT